jgi:DNA-binding transcriptional LysR family regulator
MARLKEVTPDLLVQHASVSREPGSGTREVIGKYLQKAGLAADALEVVMEASSPESLKGFVATGMAFTIMSRASVRSEMENGSLVCVPLAPPLIRNLSVVYPKERMHPRLVSAFLPFARERLAALSSAGNAPARAPAKAARAAR